MKKAKDNAAKEYERQEICKQNRDVYDKEEEEYRTTQLDEINKKSKH
jgi:hypothetical protein